MDSGRIYITSSMASFSKAFGGRLGHMAVVTGLTGLLALNTIDYLHFAGVGRGEGSSRTTSECMPCKAIAVGPPDYSESTCCQTATPAWASVDTHHEYQADVQAGHSNRRLDPGTCCVDMLCKCGVLCRCAMQGWIAVRH